MAGTVKIPLAGEQKKSTVAIGASFPEVTTFDRVGEVIDEHRLGRVCKFCDAPGDRVTLVPAAHSGLQCADPRACQCREATVR